MNKHGQPQPPAGNQHRIRIPMDEQHVGR
jgi:hypothetical protein